MNDRMEQVVALTTRATQMLLLATVVVVLVAVIGLVVAGTFGILHNGDDFSFDGFGGGGGRVNSDVIVIR